MLRSSSMRRALALGIVTLVPVTSVEAQQAGVTALPDTAVARVDRIFASLGTGAVPGCAIAMSPPPGAMSPEPPVR
jgi:hypothetical protein